MSDQQGNEAPVPQFASGTEELKQVAEVAKIALPGAQLAAQRQAKGWSVEHAASQLKFATRQVIALEADNYDALPGPVIVRGFVRAYAKLLGLDANALVATLPKDGIPGHEPIVPQRTLSTPFSESPLPLGNRSNISPGMIVGGILVLLLAGAAITVHESDLFNDVPQLAWLKSGSKSAAPADDAPAQASTETQELPEVQDGSDKSKLEKAESAVAGATSSAITTVSDRVASVISAPASKSESEPAVPEKVAVPAVTPAPAATKPATAPVVAPVPAASVNPTSPVSGGLNVSNGKDLLRLTFREDSWVEIRRNDKTTMISRLLKAGTTESFDITEPVTLVIGNAAGVDASLRGSKLDLESSNNSNVARVSLK